MIKLEVVRSYLKGATVGFIDLPNKRLQTLERPWDNNIAGKSCIPEGTYRVKRDKSGRWQYYAIQNVPSRTFIEIHPANYVNQLEGCLALGMARMEDNISVASSKDALSVFMDYVGEDDFELTFRSFNPNFDKQH